MYVLAMAFYVVTLSDYMYVLAMALLCANTGWLHVCASNGIIMCLHCLRLFWQESKLQQLENSVEGEERKWQDKAEALTRELQQVRGQGHKPSL